ncbi:MAG: Fic family protein [Candidatus Niyogibacteria bacterium]|nr:Fic family protein [Candidatus Niyogibacteria bacterium]
MIRPLTKRDVDILEERGLWKASSSLYVVIRRLIRGKRPLEIGYIKNAHRIIFETANQPGIAGKYRRDNPELKRLDGSLLEIAHWRDIPNKMAELDVELRSVTKDLKLPKTEEEYAEIVDLAIRFSHRLACIHPFENGNGRSSRLLLNAILLRAELPVVAIKEEKPQYLQAMQQADHGDFSLLWKMIVKGIIRSKELQYDIIRRKRAELAKRRRRIR